MPYLMVRHKVEDFDKWYAVFSSHAAAQQDSGLVDLQLSRDVRDANIVVVFFRIADMEKAHAFTHSKEAEQAKDDSGVIGEPEVLLLEEI
jgi:heme-degrading monooxygenase HmoA